jgi:hypothetical protein
MKVHDLDPFSLVLGTVFALIGLAFLVVHIDPVDLHLERVWPVPVIGLGLLIVVLAAASPRQRDEGSPADEGDHLEQAVDEPETAFDVAAGPEPGDRYLPPT